MEKQQCAECGKEIEVGTRWGEYCPECGGKILSELSLSFQIQQTWTWVSKRLAGFPVVTLILVALNVVVYLLISTRSISKMTQDLLPVLAMMGSGVIKGQWWRLLTYAFVHVQLTHLIGNIVFLCVLGWTAERLTGHVNFLVVCLSSAIGGSIATLYFNNPQILIFGASGIVYGLVGTLLYLYSFRQRLLPPKQRYRRIVLLATFVGISLVGEWLTFGRPNPGHIGGLLGGFIFVLLVPVAKTESKVRILSGAAAVALCLLVAAGLAVKKQKVWVELDEIDPFHFDRVDWGSIPRLERLVTDYPANLRAHQLLAEAYQSGRRYQDAVREYRYVLSKEPSSERDWYRMGWAYMDSGDSREAINAFSRTLELDVENHRRQKPEDARLSVRMDREALAGAYEAAGRVDDAIAQYKMILETNPDDFIAERESLRLKKLSAHPTSSPD